MASRKPPPKKSARPPARKPKPKPARGAARSGAKPAAKRSKKAAPAKRKTAPPKAAKRSILWRFRRSLFLVALLGVASVAGAGFVLAQVELPDEDPLLQSTFVCAGDVTDGCGPDNAIAKLSGEEDRVSVPLEEIPQTFIDAVLAAEDRQFFSHSGIDPIGIARAIYRGVRNEGAQQGGSTITQQYAKNAYLTSERTITRKLKEAVLAVKLEREFSKEEILQRYLNTVYFGRGAYGVEAASRAYFGVSIRNVDLPQAAYLAGLIRSPESADATRDIAAATRRRDSVLTAMVDVGTISRDEFDAATASPLDSQVRERTQKEGLGAVVGAEYGTEYYVEQVRRQLYATYGADVVNGGGLRVYTSIDMDLQKQAYESVYGFLDEETDPAGSLVSVDQIGRVVAMVGGKDFSASEVNLALGNTAGGSGRQPGSSFKPVVLATALEQGVSAQSKFRNVNELTLPKADNGKPYKVSNYSNGSEGILDLVAATKISSNTVYAQLIDEIGPEAVVEEAAKLGISTPVPPVVSLTLGSGEVSVLDMANAYSTFSRRGQRIDPIFVTKVEKVEDGEVKVLEQASTRGEQVMEKGNADLVNFILRQVVLGGTGSSANFGIPIAGKTGTTQDYRDAWFVGYTPKLTTAVWMGFPDLDEDGKTIFMDDVRGRKVTGGSFPAQIWRDFMRAATGGKSQGSFAAPGPYKGEVLNSDLTTTTTSTTSTTLPLCDFETAQAEGSDKSCRTTTTTTDPKATTTTKAPASSTTSTVSSTTTAPPSSSSTSQAPTTTEFIPG